MKTELLKKIRKDYKIFLLTNVLDSDKKFILCKNGNGIIYESKSIKKCKDALLTIIKCKYSFLRFKNYTKDTIYNTQTDSLFILTIIIFISTFLTINLLS